MGLALRLRPEVVQGLFATAANAPPGQWEAVAAAIAPTAAQRTTIRQLWHAYAGEVQALRHAPGANLSMPLILLAAWACCLVAHMPQLPASSACLNGGSLPCGAFVEQQSCETCASWHTPTAAPSARQPSRRCTMQRRTRRRQQERRERGAPWGACRPTTSGE